MATKKQHVWRLPEYTLTEAHLLLNGYIHNENIDLNIPGDIINLCIYYCIDFNTLNKIKSAEINDKFCSHTFCINGFKFEMSLSIPDNTSSFGSLRSLPDNSTSISPENENNHSILWWLKLISLSPTIDCISLKFELQLIEKDIKIRDTFYGYSSDILSEYVWLSNTLKQSDIINLESITFRLITFKMKIVY
eukprot:240235_1